MSSENMNPQSEKPSDEPRSNDESTTNPLTDLVKAICESIVTNLKGQTVTLESQRVHSDYCLVVDKVKLYYLRWILFYCWVNTIGLLCLGFFVQFHLFSAPRPIENNFPRAVPPAVERSYQIDRGVNGRNAA